MAAVVSTTLSRFRDITPIIPVVKTTTNHESDLKLTFIGTGNATATIQRTAWTRSMAVIISDSCGGHSSEDIALSRLQIYGF